MKILRYIRIVSLAFTAVMAVRCIEDSLAGCEYGSGLILRLSYTDGDGSDILHGMMSEAAVYVFDAGDKLVAGYYLSPSEFPGTEKVEFALPAGDYYALAWGDRPFTEPFPEQVITIHDLYVGMDGGERYHYAPVQEFGNEEYEFLRVTVPRKGMVSATLDFMPVFLSVDVWVYGLDDGPPPLVEITDIPDGFDFFLKEVAGRDRRQVECGYVVSPGGEQAAYAGFVLPYFYPGESNDLSLIRSPGGGGMATVNLLDFITENDLPARPGDRIEIYIRFSGDVIVEIGIPGWSQSPVVPEI